MTALAAFAKFFDNRDRSDVTIVITTEQPERCRARKRGQLATARKRQCREQDAGPSAVVASSEVSEDAAEEMELDQEFTAVELYGHAVVLSAHSAFFDIASSHNNGFNRPPGCEEQDAREAQYVVVSVNNEASINAATLMVKAMYGIQLPEDMSPEELLLLVTLAQQYCVEPALCAGLEKLHQWLRQAAPDSDNPNKRERWWLCGPPSVLTALYGTVNQPGLYGSLLGEMQRAEGAGEGQRLPALALAVVNGLRELFFYHMDNIIALGKLSKVNGIVLAGFLGLPAAEVAHVLASQQLRVMSEDTVFAAALRWLQANKAASRADRRTVWNTVRLLQLSQYVKSLVLGGLPEAAELMDAATRQHLAACVVSGAVAPPAHLGAPACSYSRDTLAWSRRECGAATVWRPVAVEVPAGQVRVLVLEQQAISKMLYGWQYGGMWPYAVLSAHKHKRDDLVRVFVELHLRAGWLDAVHKNASLIAPPIGMAMGRFAFQAGQGQPMLMSTPRDDLPWNCVAVAVLGTFSKSPEGAAQLQQLLTTPSGELQLKVIKCSNDGLLLDRGVKVNGPGRPPFQGPGVRLLQ